MISIEINRLIELLGERLAVGLGVGANELEELKRSFREFYALQIGAKALFRRLIHQRNTGFEIVHLVLFKLRFER